MAPGAQHHHRVDVRSRPPLPLHDARQLWAARPRRGDPVGPRGMALGIAAQAFLVVVIIGYIMLFFGLELLDLAREVAVFNLPARVAHLFGVGV